MHSATFSLDPKEPEPHQQSVDEVLSAFQTDAEAGLSKTEAGARLQRYGANELTVEKSEPGWKKFLAQFQDVLVLLLLIASLISGLLWLYEGESALPYEALAILAIVLINAIMGWIQQSRSEKALAALRRMSSAHAAVIRGGVRQSIPAAEVVPGDIMLIEEGDTVSADARLIRTTVLQTMEAVLTGESLPVPKDASLILEEEVGLGERLNMIFSGTVATYGRGRAVAVATGMQTQMGRIAVLLKDTPTESTPLQKQLDRVGRLLGIVVVAVAVVMVATIILVEDVSGFAAFFSVLLLGVALAVAAVPEGLPAVVTTVLSIGVLRMVRRNAIIRRLAAVETLGSTNVIASDKTGTLTKNEMSVRVVATTSGRVIMEGAGYEPVGKVRRYKGGGVDGKLRCELMRAFTAADLANNAVLKECDGRWTVEGDPTEGALIVAARKAGLEQERLNLRFERIAEVPFSSERKLMSTLHTDAEQKDLLILHTKGAPDILIGRCSQELIGEEIRPLGPARRQEIMKINDDLSADALRTIGVAFRHLPVSMLEQGKIDERVEQDLVFLGLIGMIDPPREEAGSSVELAKKAGIRPIMITGDHPGTAAVIARELGIAKDGLTVTGAEIERMSDETLDRVVKEVSVYARVNPEHKLRIVKALQRGGLTVAMTGDGVNDAPALKTADIGIAMGITGTDVSRQAADMVLADDNFASIVAAVEEGRGIFSNIRKFLRYLLSSNIGEVLTMFFGVLLAEVIGLSAKGGSGLVLPLSAAQVLWINLVTDGAPALALGVDPRDHGIMNETPRPRHEAIITRRMWAGILFVGAVMAVGTLLVLDASLPGGLIDGSGSMSYAQTMAFTTLVMFQLFNALNARSENMSAFIRVFGNFWLWGAILLSLALQAAVIYMPSLQKAFSTVNLSLGDWLLCIGVSSSVLWLRELYKLVARTASRKHT
ncbi:MAG: cation-translocating P-type ATPase [Syntrophobacteraceae bacterium]